MLSNQFSSFLSYQAVFKKKRSVKILLITSPSSSDFIGETVPEDNLNQDDGIVVPYPPPSTTSSRVPSTAFSSEVGVVWDTGVDGYL
jgi:hypothetical protein